MTTAVAPDALFGAVTARQLEPIPPAHVKPVEPLPEDRVLLKPGAAFDLRPDLTLEDIAGGMTAQRASRTIVYLEGRRSLPRWEAESLAVWLDVAPEELIAGPKRRKPRPEKKGEPRMQKPKQQRRPWTEAEDAVLRDFGHLGAAKLKRDHLPERAMSSIYKRAASLGVKMAPAYAPPIAPRHKPEPTAPPVPASEPPTAATGAITWPPAPEPTPKPDYRAELIDLLAKVATESLNVTADRRYAVDRLAELAKEGAE